MRAHRQALNAELTQAVLTKRWPQLGLLEINNVCDGGPELLAAIKKVYV